MFYKQHDDNMRPLIIIFLSIFILIPSKNSIAQEIKDSVYTLDTIKQLDEIVVTGRRKLSNYRQEKTLSSIDQYLEKSNKITMIKRGNYAWEPTINNMVSDRISVTIDGMQIYGACTDKMDPVTSYVDVSNLEKVTVNSGQEGTENGSCIGGNLDMKLPETTFYNSGFKAGIDAGYETNGNYKSSGLDFSYATNSFFINTDAIYRKSDNYIDGNGNEILYSQFEKYNISLQTGYKLSENNKIEGVLIYDRANDVGYPALPMDVSLAKATITSLAHIYTNDSTTINRWETKIYYNTITHTMDDSKRPDVPIRMDMPGWSDTYGFYSKASLNIKKHQITTNLNGHYNRSIADMTMYPNDPNENSMYMYTWPDVKTFDTGLFIKDLYKINTNESIKVSTRIAYHQNRIDNKIGLQSLQIFYPDMKDSKSRILPSISTNYIYKKKQFNLNIGLGYGERAPSVSEGYGFYLFNSFDGYDYIGNPNLNNEKSLEVHLNTNYKKKNVELGLETSYFYIKDYIIGKTSVGIIPMTIGANGVRIYTAFDYATIFSSALTFKYDFITNWSFNSSLGYNYGQSNTNENLPLIRPVSYFTELNYNKHKFNASIQVKGNGNQTNYNMEYGEDETPAYTIMNINFGNKFNVKNNTMILKYGVENVFDTYYSTYADWNNFPRQGRNFYINISYILMK